MAYMIEEVLLEFVKRVLNFYKGGGQPAFCLCSVHKAVRESFSLTALPCGLILKPQSGRRQKTSNADVDAIAGGCGWGMMPDGMSFRSSNLAGPQTDCMGDTGP